MLKVSFSAFDPFRTSSCQFILVLDTKGAITLVQARECGRALRDAVTRPRNVL